jgi:putative multiple sugar transport system substrate-binding protein
VKTRRILVGAIAVSTAIAMSACGSGRGGTGTASKSSGNAGALVGISMPTQTDPGWKRGGDVAAAALRKAGYTVDIEYANNDIPTQVQQISNMLTKGAKALIIAPIDGTALSDQLDEAGKHGTKVVAYDRLILGSKNVNYYVTFDNNKIGEEQGTALLEGLGVLDASGTATGKTGPYNIEVFAGSPDDPNAALFYGGYMKIIKPYIDKKVLHVTSGQTDLASIGTPNWDPAKAQARMQNLIARYYSNGTKLDGVIAPDDNSGTGVISALTSAGYKGHLPVIIGLGAIPTGVKAVIAGEQYATIFKDLRLQANRAATIVDQDLSGKTVEINDPQGFDNKVTKVPTYLYDAQIVTKANSQKVLIDSGYFTQADLS